jgi:uncharacterized membrane protein required for colicin V production
MNGFDAVIVVVVLGVGFLGFRIGLMRAVFLLGAFILASICGSIVSDVPSTMLEKVFPNPNVRELAVFTAIFLPVFVIVNIIGSVACKSVKSKPMKWVDCLIGSAIGILIGIIFIGLVIVYLTKSPTENSDKWLEGSGLAPKIKSIVSPILRQFQERKPIGSMFVLNRETRSG